MNKQFEFFTVSNSNDDEYSACLQIYLQSFPDNERQPTWLIKQRVNTGVATLYGGRRYGITAAMALLFHLKNSDFLLLDYFAVNAVNRGKGTGAMMFEQIAMLARKNNKQLILEVEDPAFGNNSNEKSRRISFYQSKGATVIPNVIYAQPAMTPGMPATEMKLMILPAHSVLSVKAIKELIVKLYKEVYSKPENDELLLKLLVQFENK